MADNTPSTHEIKLNNISCKYLHDLLQSLGWTRNVSDVILAGQVLVDKMPANLEKEARKLTDDKFEEWAEKVVTFTISEKQREVCKFVIEKFAKEGKLPSNKYGKILTEAFGFTAEE